MIFLLAIQQVYSSCPKCEQRFIFEDNKVTEISFEANDALPGIYGDVPAGRIVINTFLTETDCDPGISKSKNVFSGLTFSVTKSNLEFFIAQSSVFTRYSAVYIPIYLQTASFLL